jgi:uncharacterized membrane protein YphA (DoxX/SURF4 family)
MNIVLWIIAVVLAVAFLASGVVKLARSKEQLASNMGWVDDFPARTVKLIGALEILAAVGLVLPAALDILPVLVPLAALGLVLIMIGAGITHARRHETPVITINVVLGLLAAVVVWGRLGPYQF